VRATEEMLRIVPMDLREASYALGVPKWKTIVRIVIPTAWSVL
jgi:phosphate transport system permease protein